MKRKLISLLLVLAMCLSILPMQVFASETTGTDVQASEETSPMLQVDPAVITVEKVSAGSPEGEMASNLFDGNIKDTKWCITNDTGWVAFATGVPIRLSQMKGYFAKQSNNHVDKDYPNVKGYKLQAFDGDGKPADADYEDASKWKDIGVVTDNTASTLVTPLTMTKPARYFRLEVTDPGSNAKNAIRFYELELFSSFLEPVQVKFAPGSIEGAKITGTMAPVQAYQGSGYVLPRCEFTCDNVEYVFNGWKAGDSAEIHAPESNMLITGPVTLTAQWIKSDSVRFEAGTPAENVAAAGKMAAVAVLKGQKYTLPDCEFRAEGYLFNGWKMGSDPEIKQPGTIITISDSVILTAQWVKGALIRFAAEPPAEGVQVTETMADQLVKPGTYTLPDCEFRAEGYLLSQWSVAVDGAAAVEKQPGDTITVQESALATVVWSERHVHEDLENQVWSPAGSAADIQGGSMSSTEMYYYAVRDLDLTGYPFPNGNSHLHLCMNGKSLTGNMTVPNIDLNLYSHGNAGSITGKNGPVVKYDTGSAELRLHGGSLKQPGTAADPVVLASYRGNDIQMDGGSMVQEAANQPAVLIKEKECDFYLSGGSVTTAGGPAVQFSWAADPSSALHLGGAPVLDVGEGTAHIKVNNPRQVSAACNGKAYTGEAVIRIDCSDLKIGDVVVTDVTDENAMKFRPTDDALAFACVNRNLALVQKGAASGELSFVIGEEAAGTKPDNILDYAGVPVSLPMGGDLKNGEQILVGWQDGTTQKKYAPGESYTSTGEPVVFTALWGPAHSHDDRTWSPVYSSNALTVPDRDSFYAMADLELVVQNNFPANYFYYCMNGHTTTGNFEVPNMTLYLYDCTENPGTIVGKSGPVVDFWTSSSTLHLCGGSLKQEETANAPVIHSNKNRDDVKLEGGALIQEGSGPAILVSGSNVEITLTKGSITTAGGPAIELGPNAGKLVANVTKDVTFTLQGGAHYKVSKSAQLSAGTESSAYQGPVVTIDTSALRYHDIVVTDVTEANQEKFVPADETVEFRLKNGNLVLMPKGSTEGALSFDLGGHGDGVKPDDMPIETLMPVILPGIHMPVYDGWVFLGWKDGISETLYPAGASYTPAETAVTLTAQWRALEDGYYLLQDAQDFQMFAAIVARDQNYLKAKLMADITLDNAASRIGTKGHPFIGEFDGNGHTVTVSRIVDRENCGGVFDYVNGGARIHDLQVAGSMQTTEKFTGGLIGRIMNKEPNAPTVFLERCSVAVALTTDLSGDNTVGGIFGLNEQISGKTAEIIMTDVLFTGKLVTNSGGSHIGGFGGFQQSTNNTLQNCLMAGDLSNAGAEESDAVIRNGTKGVNCYYLPSGSITTSQAEKVTAKALASGEIAYRLGTGTRTGKNPWRQNLTGEHIDPVPTLDSTHAKVLKITFAVVNGTMDSAETTLYVNPGKLTADQIPTDMKPNAAYETGSWNMDPATTELTEDTTFTYTFGNEWATDVAHTAEGVQMTINEKLTNATVVAAIYDGERLIAAAAKTVETLEAGGQLLVELPANDQSTMLKLFVMDEHHAPIHAAQKLEKQ